MTLSALKYVRVISLILACIVLNSPVFTQKVYTKADVKEMFPKNVKDLWINYLSGHLDGIHLVDMIIGTDGHTCKGLYTMRNSGTTFFFEGDDNDHQLKLVELTPESRMSGFIVGKYDGENLDAQWMTTDKNRSLPFKLSFVNAFENHQADICKQSQWQRIFSGKEANKDIRFHLIRDHLTFTAISHEGDKKMKDIKVGKGSRVEVFEFNLEQSLLSGKSIVIDTSNLDKISIVHLDENGYEVSSLLKLEASLDFKCYEYADYHSRLVANKLKSGNTKFDLWIEKKYKTWVEESIEKHKKALSQIGTKDRWIQYSEGWVEVDLFSGDIISGTIYLQSSLYHGTEKIPFIYDLKNSKELTLQDLFDKKFDSKSYFDLIIPAIKLEKYSKIDCKKWLDTQTFHYVTLKENGICFRTDFHTIHGEKEILIPYDQVEQNFKNRNLLKDILIK